MAETCKPKRNTPMTVKVKSHLRKGRKVKGYRRHTPR